MLKERALSGVVLIALAISAILAGGNILTLCLLAVLSIGTTELVQLVAWKGHRAFGGLMSLWIALFLFDRAFPHLNFLNLGLTLLLLATLGWAVIRFRQGTANAVTGFALTIAGGFYLGWTGAHFISLRTLEEGLFWTLTICVAVWSSDTLAYLVGSQLGRTRLIPDISPGKTWEGYLGGVIGASLITSLVTLAWQQLGASSTVSPRHGLIIGLLISTVSPLGDIGISMFKRYAGTKNSSRLIPGHGGLLDRMDALLIAGMVGYYYLDFFVI
ncbi:MAG: phosphatidate cytidylyltransferase [Anaerolineae bacterium]|nr:phosphatidate cytidylyltransferase [Anaerolineae bacterium]